ncbi:hypothetical protein Salat_2628400 [Sesamum alatum]|uniref:Uncharacterized protein n=1 Tax=Sesamum alatum TaxID=300844 RepID=A0AAE1XPJ2_9LAMI|nr:hypothetical protein Salat_2628400 [Sesamum alatum]
MAANQEEEEDHTPTSNRFEAVSNLDDEAIHSVQSRDEDSHLFEEVPDSLDQLRDDNTGEAQEDNTPTDQEMVTTLQETIMIEANARNTKRTNPQLLTIALCGWSYIRNLRSDPAAGRSYSVSSRVGTRGGLCGGYGQ